MWRPVRIPLRRQPSIPVLGDSTLINLRNARQWRPFADWCSVSGLQIWAILREIVDSLRLIFEMFPFSGDSNRRPGSICTAWSSLQSRALALGSRQRLGHRREFKVLPRILGHLATGSIGLFRPDVRRSFLERPDARPSTADNHRVAL